MCGPLGTYAGCRQRATGALYHASRFAILLAGGALAGAFGEGVVLRLSAHWAQVALSTMVGLALSFAAVRALRLYTRRRRGVDARKKNPLVTLRVPSRAPQQKSRRWLRAGALGALTPLLPCGATWSLWMLAVGTATPLHGALVAAAFFVPTALSVQFSAVLASRFARVMSARSLSRGHGIFALIFAFGALVTLLRPVEAVVAFCR